MPIGEVRTCAIGQGAPRLRIALLGLNPSLLARVYLQINDANLLVLPEYEDKDFKDLVDRFEPDLFITDKFLWPQGNSQRMTAVDCPANKPSAAKPGTAAPCRLLNFSPTGSGGGPLGRLTPRQREVLLLVYKGLRNSEIAQHFGVSVRTVKGWLTQLFDMFDVSNRTELIGSAVELGLLAEGGECFN